VSADLLLEGRGFMKETCKGPEENKKGKDL
jgi:hypothetical protein